MTSNELKTLLIEDGWQISIDSFPRARTPIWYAYRLALTDVRCECNDKAPVIVVKPSDNWDVCEISLTGEKNGDWYELRSYNVPYDEFMQKLPGIQTSLTTAWSNMFIKFK